MSISKKKRKQAIKLYDKYEKNIAKKIENKLVRYFNAQGKRIATAVKKEMNKKADTKITKEEAEKQAESIIKKSYNFTTDIAELRNILAPLLLAAGTLGNELANIRLYASKEDYQLFAVIEDKYLKFLDQHGLKQAKNITETTRKNASRVIRDGIINGRSYTEIVDDIVAYTKIHSRARARTIAATEVHTSFLTARDLNAREGGFKEKHWLDSDDASVRPNHVRYDNMGYVDIDYVYDNDVSYPGDYRGSASNIVNCRCEISYK